VSGGGGKAGRIGRALGRAACALLLTAIVAAWPPNIAQAKPTITQFGGGLRPGVITAGPDGHLWWLEARLGAGEDWGPGCVATMATSGHYLNCFEQGTGFLGHLTVGPDNNLWFTETVEEAGAIGRITPSGQITTFTSGFTGIPESITAGPDGNLWFTQLEPPAIGRIDLSGHVTLFTAGLPSAPLSITKGPDNNLWFTASGHNIGRITPSGEISIFTVPGLPRAIISGPGRDLWFTVLVAYGSRGRVGKISTSGHVTEYARGINGEPSYLAAGPAHSVWFTEYGLKAGEEGRVGRITQSGRVTEWTHGFAATPYDITEGPDGNMWFTETSPCGAGCFLEPTEKMIGRINIRRHRGGKHRRHRHRRHKR
jgi:streptogramin lyase